MMRIREIVVMMLAAGASIVSVMGKSGSMEATEERVQQIASMQGLLAFWDFDKESEGVWQSQFDADVIGKTIPLHLARVGDDREYSLLNWPYDDDESSIEFDHSGPLGRAFKCNLGYIYASATRASFDGTGLDINRKDPFTLVTWVKLVGQRHLIAGIWDEGGWDRYRGRRQVALFAGLFGQKGLIAHISATGAASYPQSTARGSQYARVRAIDGQAFADEEWVMVAMSYDPQSGIVTASLNGVATPLKLADPVEDDVLQFDEVPSANPLHFPWPIYSPTSFVMKFNGYDVHGPVKEHALLVDLEQNTLRYKRLESETLGIPYRVEVDVMRDGKVVASSDFRTKKKSVSKKLKPRSYTVQRGDVAVARLSAKDDGRFTMIGSEINREVEEGAPFTVGRALGLGANEIDHGSTLFVDGVAVFNRVLSTEELKELSFGLSQD